MNKVAIVFWSATGNTETMANCIAEGTGANGIIVPCTEMTPAKLAEFDVVAFGCPAMGAEQLEESEFEPMFAALEAYSSLCSYRHYTDSCTGRCKMRNWPGCRGIQIGRAHV